ncbi:unnamed protein product [Rotaria sp. Silwood2]|nr:unnamed protein product [Rotaria sp. Silwood2]CAF4172140.1 unnamed protein product [Rotaria sp. Silwood2]CAF4242587.1 unnamed protein product [Rotaria sp. Silwood2]
MRHFEEESKKCKIYEQVASCKEKELDKDGDDILVIDTEEIPQARPFGERYSAILNVTVSDTDSQSNVNSNSEHKKDSSESNDNSETEEEDGKKRKLRDTSISPTSKEKIDKINIRKTKAKPKKKKTTSIENDPSAPKGSPVLLVSNNNSREQTSQVVQKKTRQDTPVDSAAKRPQFGAHFVKPPKIAPRSQQQQQQQQEVVTQPEEEEEEEEVLSILPRTPPCLPAPPVLSPRQSTPRTPVAPPRLLQSSPQPEPSVQIENNQIKEQVIPMEQDIVRNSLSVISKGIGNFNIDLFDFPIISIECKFHFKIFHIKANRESITANREFLEKKSKQQERELEELMKQFKEDEHRLIVQYIKDSIEPVIDILKDSNKKRLDNLVLDQMKEKALRTIRNKSNKDSLELLDKAQIRFERMLQLEFQLDKLDRRLNENIPPSALNIMDKLQFRSKELNKEVKDQYSEQWNNVIRKTKEKSDKNNRKIARAIERNSRAKNLHPHYTPLGFPPHVNNKVLGLTDEERRILNYGPKFVFENPKQALDRLEEEIRIMKDKVVEAWRRETHTTGRNPILVEQFANRLEEEVRNKINEGVTRDPIVEKTLERFQKEQKKGKVIFRQTDKSKDCFNEVGASDSKANHMESADDLRYVAQRGYEAMIKGEHRAYGSTIIKLMVGAGQVILNEIITEVTRRVIEKDN